MTSKSRILVCGDVNGKFKTLFAKVERVNKKQGPFAFLLCVGNFFGDSADSWKPYHDGLLTVPVTTYILGPRSPEQVKFFPDINGSELATNVSYLGKRGVMATSSGLRMAYVSGAESDGKEQAEHMFVDADVLSVRDVSLRGRPNFRGVDILASSTWPKHIVHVNVDLQQSSYSWKLSWLANQIKPRYYFCPSNTVYYERPPYRLAGVGEIQLQPLLLAFLDLRMDKFDTISHSMQFIRNVAQCRMPSNSNHSSTGDTSMHATRFIALAAVGNALDQKWLYAASLEPIDKMSAADLYQSTTDQTECPFSGNMLLPSLSKTQVEHTSQFFYDMNPPKEEDNQRKRPRNEDGGPARKQRPVFDQDSCWFCLSSADVEKHLVISIGEEAYLALAKGGLVPDHLLILPVTHHQSLSDVPETVVKEIKKFKSALKSYFSTQSKVPVFYERNYKTSHLQIQVVPVDEELSDRLKEVFQDSAEAEGFELDELPPHSKLDQIAPPGTPYFYVELPTGEKLFHGIRKSFPLQFGRVVLASSALLDMEERGDWRDCKISKDEETALAKQFRAAFHKFDFTV